MVDMKECSKKGCRILLPPNYTYKQCSLCREKHRLMMRDYTRKNKDRLNAQRRQKNTERYGIKSCLACKEDIPYNGNNRSYSKIIYCSDGCSPSSQKEYKNKIAAKSRAKRGPKIYSEEEKKYFRDYYQQNKEKYRKQNKIRYDNRTEEQKEADRKYSKNWHKNMTQEQRDKKNESRRKNRKRPEIRVKERQQLRDWHKKNPHKYREYYEKHRKDPIKVLRRRISNAMRHSLKYNGIKKTNKTFSLLGFTKYELKEHLESQFTDGMSWDNMSEWHIDHIIPVSAFKIDSVEHPDFHTCWALGNLRPMWAKDNLSKGNKIPGVDYI
tara:strand:+ start:57 stop:1031 length:975 start_codon:yes stop_codon:yes gene_type:complete